MKSISRLLQFAEGLHKLSKAAIYIGIVFAAMMYITAFVAWKYAPVADNYLYALAVQRTAMEAGPACLAVGIVSGLLGDMMLQGKDS